MKCNGFAYDCLELGDVIKDIAAGPFGSKLKISSFVESGFPIIDGANLKGFKVTDNITKFVTEEKARSLHRAIARRGDVVVTISGTIGQIAYIPDNSFFEEYLVSQRQFRVTFDSERAYAPYIVFYLHTYEGQQKILSFANQVGVPALAQPLKNFKKIPIKLPSLENQRKIAGIIELLDDKIELNNAMNKNLEQQAQLVFEERFIRNEYSVHTSASLGDVCRCELGGTPSRAKEEYWNGSIPWINSGEVNKFRIITPSEFITTEGLCHSATKLLPAKTTVLAITGATLGQVSLLEIGSCANQSVVGVIPNEKIPYEFIYLFIKSNIQNLLSNQTGGAQQHINKQNVENLNVAVPSKEVLEDFRGIVSPMYETIAVNCFENSRLQEFRDAILPKLMSGAIDVSSLDF